jgi:CRISPR/Cas system CMR-associated protein Cmr1 (group 7 of RAMP superfamily)
MGIDLTKLMAEFGEEDFGFSEFEFDAVSEADYNSVIDEKADTVEELKERLSTVEKMIIPFLIKLIKTSDKEYIYWPNRKPVIEKQIEKILAVTRENVE